MQEGLNNYYLDHEEPNRSCLLAMQHLIKSLDENVSESIKWGLPCFSYKNKIFCFLNVYKTTNEPYILFAEGALLNHPKLEQEDRKVMKIFRVNPCEDLPVETIRLLLNLALDLYHKGIIKTK